MGPTFGIAKGAAGRAGAATPRRFRFAFFFSLLTWQLTGDMNGGSPPRTTQIAGDAWGQTGLYMWATPFGLET